MPYPITDPYTSSQMCLNRLSGEYAQHGSLFVAFDFDNTVYDIHHKGYVYDRVEDLLRACKKLGFKLILFTCKETQVELEQCAAYCERRGYAPDYINESPLMDTRKPYYNILLDDRAGLCQAVELLEELIDIIRMGLLDDSS